MITSKMWEYFLQCESDDGVKRAQCTFCEGLLSYSSTTHNLKTHLMRRHPEEIGLKSREISTPVLTDINPEQRKQRRLNRKNESVIWSFFAKSESKDKVATCNLCNKNFSYRSTNTNLRKHLERTHPNEFTDSTDYENGTNYNESSDDTVQSNSSDDESSHSAGESDAWSFFEKETGGRARCVVCRASLPHRIGELRQHLKDNHPKLAKDFDRVYVRDDEQNDTYTEVVYLEEESRKIKKPQKTSRLSHHVSSMVKPAKIRKLSSSCDNERHDENDDQIKQFSTYVASLLKEVPKDACMKLQMEIINLIMTTKLKLPTETENKVIIDGVPVAIQTVSAVPGSGFIVTVPTTVSAVHSATVAPTTLHRQTTPIEDVNEPIKSECRDLPKL